MNDAFMLKFLEAERGKLKTKETEKKVKVRVREAVEERGCGGQERNVKKKRNRKGK